MSFSFLIKLKIKIKNNTKQGRVLHILWMSTVGIPFNKQDWTSQRKQMSHILGPIAVSFIEQREILVEDASILEPIYEEELEAEDLCHGTR